MKDIVQFADSVVSETASINRHADQDWRVLGGVAEVIGAWGKDFGEIYASVLLNNARAKMLTDGLNPTDHAQAFAVWYENLASGLPGEVFWAETCLIGLAHAAAGVNNGQVLAMGSLVEDEFLARALDAFADTAQALRVYRAFKRVFGVALAVMVDSYMHAIMQGMEGIGMNERLVEQIRKVAIRRMIEEARSVLPLIDWSDALSVGVPSIDEQHKKLVEILNRLHDSSVRGTGNEQLKTILDELVQYTISHFAAEERFFDEHDYPDAQAHKESHVALAKQVAAFNAAFQAGDARLSGDLFKFLRSWLNGHIRGTDKLYGPYLCQHGVR